MRRIVLTTKINAPVSRVWRALCDPAEVVCWDAGVIAAINAPADYPQPGQRVRWEYRSVHWPTLIDRPQEVVPEQRLRSILELGPYYMDETYALAPVEGGTLLTTTIDLTVRRWIFGPLFERLWAGREVRQGFEASLAGLKRYCEAVKPGRSATLLDQDAQI
jgi:uncharacterized protein YndB with AHSA1/START domain